MTTPLMPLKQVHIVRRANPDTPADAPPLPGDTIHVELDSGYVPTPSTRSPDWRPCDGRSSRSISPLGYFLVKDQPQPPVVARDPETGISIRFIRSYDVEADRWPKPTDVETVEAQRRYNAMVSALAEATTPIRRREPWWVRLGCWLYWHGYDRWRDRDACE